MNALMRKLLALGVALAAADAVAAEPDLAALAEMYTGSPSTAVAATEGASVTAAEDAGTQMEVSARELYETALADAAAVAELVDVQAEVEADMGERMGRVERIRALLVPHPADAAKPQTERQQEVLPEAEAIPQAREQRDLVEGSSPQHESNETLVYEMLLHPDGSVAHIIHQGQGDQNGSADGGIPVAECACPSAGVRVVLAGGGDGD